jgi:carboxyl-terminal processing protease
MWTLTIYRKWITASVMVALLAVVFTGGYLLGTHSPNAAVEAQGNQPQETEELFVPFWEAWNLLHDYYVNPLDDNALMEGAITGMMQSLGDPHTDYMDPQTFARVNEGMSGEYEGIGATVRKNEETGGLELISIIRGSPAENAGLVSGDQIVEVDGEDVTSWTQEEIIAVVRGPAGTTVHLGILRPGEEDLLYFDVTRERITLTSVAYEVLDGNIGYIRLSQFEMNSGDLMRDALREMDANNLNGLILDVRSDPGGFLSTAIDVASIFLQDGVVLIERTPDNEIVHNVLGNAVAPDVPLVLLVDQGSASASELIAGALQDQGRATIVGMKTFGKGSVQTWRELSNGGGVRITISLWFTPNGNSVNDVGITPDIEVPFDPEAAAQGEDNQLQAAIEVLQAMVENREPQIDVPLFGLDHDGSSQE